MESLLKEEEEKRVYTDFKWCIILKSVDVTHVHA